MPPDPLALAILFLSTLSLRRATQITVMQATDAMPFLSTLSLRRATIPCGYFVTPIVFLSTLSLRRATLLIVAIRGIVLNFYPRSPCGERRLIPDARELSSIISIHALLAESDLFHQVIQRRGVISIHALLAESDTMFPCFIIIYIKFLSTLSLRRATRCSSVSPNRSGFLSTLSLRRATRAERYANSQQEFLSTLSLRRATNGHQGAGQAVLISIHALLAESDLATLPDAVNASHFYPRSPCGERLHAAHFFSFFGGISIHALLAESDATCTKVTATPSDFYPRSPCGERPRASSALSLCSVNFYPRSPCGERRAFAGSRRPPGGFLSTLSLRRATAGQLQQRNARYISIHALLAESDAFILFTATIS